MLSRRNFLLGLGAGTAALAGGAGYARLVEPRWLEITPFTVPLDRGGAPLRVLQLSDFHAGQIVPLDYIAGALDLGIEQQPDLILLTGDYINLGDEVDVTIFAALLRRLSVTAPTFACLGNHDGGRWTSARLGGQPIFDRSLALLEQAGIHCLVNQNHSLTVRGRAVQLIGLGDLWNGLCDPEAAFAATPVRGDALRLVLSHNPDAKNGLRHYDWDLLLCGHTHGGQVRLPFLGAPFAPVRDKRYLEGLHFWENHWLHVTRGVGNVHGVRINCRPQISVLTLT